MLLSEKGHLYPEYKNHEDMGKISKKKIKNKNIEFNRVYDPVVKLFQG